MSANQYYDSNIYMQSTNLVIKVAYMYYYKKMRKFPALFYHFNFSHLIRKIADFFK